MLSDMPALLSRPAPAYARLGLSLLLGLLVALALRLVPTPLPLMLHLLAGWCASAAFFLAWVWRSIRRADAEQTRRLASREDDSRAVSGLLLLAGCLVSLLGSGLALAEAGRLEQQHPALGLSLTALALLTVTLSWLLIQTEHTLHYAHMYYQPPVGGLNFHAEDDPEGEQPDYRDFAYLAYTVGMTYQVSDTEVNHKRFRRRIVGHALLAFLFGTVIVAFTINVVAGLIH